VQPPERKVADPYLVIHVVVGLPPVLQRLLADGERAQLERLGVRISAHAPIDQSEVVQLLRNVEVVVPKTALADGERALELLLRVGKAAPIDIDAGEIVQNPRIAWIAGAELLF